MKALRHVLFVVVVLMFLGTGPLSAKDSAVSILNRLPKKIGGYEHGQMSDYGDPRLGASVPFNGDGLTITLYVYDLGHEKIASGLGDPVVQQAYEMAKHDIQVAKERGSYESVNLLSEGRSTFQGREAALQATYEMVLNLNSGGSVAVFSEIYAFGAWNQIFKLRITAKKEARETLAPKVAEFVADLLKAVEFLPPAKP